MESWDEMDQGKRFCLNASAALFRLPPEVIKVREKLVGKDIDIPKDMGIIIESPGFLPEYSGFNNLKFLAKLQNKISKKKIKETMLFVGLDPDEKNM